MHLKDSKWPVGGILKILKNNFVVFQKTETSEKSVKDIALKAIESSAKVQIVEKEKVIKE